MHENFHELVKIYVFSFLFGIFWAFLTRFPACLFKSFSCLLLSRPFGSSIHVFLASNDAPFAVNICNFFILVLGTYLLCFIYVVCHGYCSIWIQNLISWEISLNCWFLKCSVSYRKAPRWKWPLAHFMRTGLTHIIAVNIISNQFTSNSWKGD